jgi:hypothetical protein
MKKPKNRGFEPVHPKNVLLASVVHGISCLFYFLIVIFHQHILAGNQTENRSRQFSWIVYVMYWNLKFYQRLSKHF